MAGPELLTVTRTQGNNEALKSGEVVPRGYRFVFEEVPVLVRAFRRMVRGLEFDVCEMALTTYLVARAHGVPFTAVPAFLVRGFHHAAIHRATGSDVHTPKDLEGRRVGVSRGYTVTTGVWARAILHEEHGVDLEKVTWVLSGDEHVSAYRPPANVEPMEPGRTLEDMLRAGDLAAVVGADVSGPGIEPLIPDPAEAGFRALEGRGLYPINHLVVVRDSLLAERPDVAAAVFEAFARAKRHYVERLIRGGVVTESDRMYARVMRTTGADPLPYGIEPNRTTLERLLRHAADQHILDEVPAVEEVFAPSTRHLVA